MFILHSMISQNHSEMPRDKIVDHNPVPIYLHCKESARVESQLWSNVSFYCSYPFKKDGLFYIVVHKVYKGRVQKIKMEI